MPAAEWLNVSDTDPRIGYTATSGQTVFTVPFVFFENTDLSVYQNGTLLGLGSNYTVTGAEAANGGRVTLAVGATVGDAIMIVSHVPIAQTTHIPPSGPLDVPAINIQFSKLVRMIQQVADGVDRSVRLSDDTFGVMQPSVPVPGEFLKWNATGDGVESTVVISPDGTYAIATKSEAEDGTRNDVLMTPLRTIQAINALAGQTFDTRADAIAATIASDVTFIRTWAYDNTFTENSGATFKRVASGTPFTDTWPLTGTIVGGTTAAPNGTYYFGLLSGSATGSGICGTITVTGGTITGVDHWAQPGNAYKVGDVLTIGSFGLPGGPFYSVTGFTYTVATISSPLASFVNTNDSSRWQYVESKGFPHVNEFGAKPDWISTDSGATNNFASIQAALFYATCNLTGTPEGGGGYAGGKVMAGRGTYMIRHPSNLVSLIIPNGVTLEGVGGTSIKIHNSWYPATHCICLGNPNAHFANFRSMLRNVGVAFTRGIDVALGTFLIYSNNNQDGGGLDEVSLYTGQFGGFKYEIGYGGASTVKFHNLSIACEGINPAAYFNVGTTIVDCRTWSVSAPSSGRNDTNDAIILTGTGGTYKFDGVHMEGQQNGFSIDLRAGNNPMASFKNITGGLHLAWVFTIVGTSQSGRFSFEQCQMNNGLATGLIQNGLSGGSNRLTDIAPGEGVVGY